MCFKRWNSFCVDVYCCYHAGVSAGQMYTYPARCWRKKRRLHNATDPRLGIYGLQLGKTLQPVSLNYLPIASCSLSLPAHLSLSLSLPLPPSSPTHLLQLMWLLVMIWNNLAKSISLSLRTLSRTGCQSFFREWNVAVFTPAGKLVLWEVEHVIRFATAGSSETEFGHCRQYLINVIECSLAFLGLPLETAHSKRLRSRLQYILPVSYFVLTTSLADWFCLFPSGSSSIRLYKLRCSLCVFCGQWSWAWITVPKACIPTGMLHYPNEHGNRETYVTCFNLY